MRRRRSVRADARRALAFSLLLQVCVQPSPLISRASAASRVVTAESSSLPSAARYRYHTGDETTAFDVDVDWVRYRLLGLECSEHDDDGGPPVRRRRNDSARSNDKRGGLLRRRPRLPRIRLPRLRLPRIKIKKFDVRKLGENVGRVFPFQKRRQGGTHLRSVATSFERVLNAHHRHGRYGPDDIDVSELLEACRSFLPVMRSFGPDVAAKDFAKNLKKADALRKGKNGNKGGGEKKEEKKKDRRNDDISAHPERPTLEELLRKEVDAGIHQPGGILKDPSGAVGLLWMRRSIAYQHDLFSAFTAGADPRTAAVEAYSSQLKPYHSWALKRIYTAYMGAMMPASRRELLAQVGGFDEKDLTKEDEEATMDDLKRLVALWKPLLAQWKRTHEELDLEDYRRH